MSQEHVQEHVDLIAKQEQAFLAARSVSERVGDRVAAFAGTLTFVVCHLVVFVAWALVNTVGIDGVSHFDPPPFALLGTLLALEAILLASFILMRQARIGRRSDEREHLMLQVLLLTEKEMTAVVGMVQRIARQVGLEEEAMNPELDVLAQKTSVDAVARAIEQSLPDAP